MIRLFDSTQIAHSSLYEPAVDARQGYRIVLVEDQEMPDAQNRYDTLTEYIGVRFGGDRGAFFASLASEPTILYLSLTAYAEVVVQFLKDLYPLVPDDEIVTLSRLFADHGPLVVNKITNITPDQAREIAQLSLTDKDIRPIVETTAPINFLTAELKQKLGIEFLYLDYLVNGTDSPVFDAFSLKLKDFMFQHLAILQESVSKLCDLPGSLPDVPLKLTVPEALNNPFVPNLYEIAQSRVPLQSGEVDVKTFLHLYGAQVLSTVKGEE